jgi:hypothetical protein
MHVQITFNSSWWKMHYDPPLGGSSEGLFIGTVRGSGNNVRAVPLTVPFTLSAQSQRYYSHFTPLTTLHWTYYTVTHVFPGHDLRLTTPFGPLALDHRLTLITVLVTDLHRHGCSWPPLPSTCQVVKQGLVHELVNAKLIMLSDVGGAIGTGL